MVALSTLLPPLPVEAKFAEAIAGPEPAVDYMLSAPSPPGDLDQWLQRASAGDAYAQWVVAQKRLAAGVPYREEALAAFRQSAEAGYAQAELDWGRILIHGLYGVTAEPGTGLRWIERAEQSGNAEAAYELAVAYWSGTAGAVDRTKSLHWLKRSAEKGWARAREGLGLLLRDGVGTPRDASQAVIWLELAANQGRPGAKFALAALLAAGDGVERDDARALHSYRELAKAGYLPAEKMVAAMLAEGRGAETDLAALRTFLEKSALAGYANAAYELGTGLVNGRFGPVEREAGVRWVGQAAAADHPLAQFELAWLGEAPERRVAWLRRSANLGYTPAEFYLGMAYAYGTGITADDRIAIDWYRRAAGKGYMEAQSSLAWRYIQGVSMPQDDAQGIDWARRAADQGNELSMKNLVARLLSRRDKASRSEALVWIKRLAAGGHSHYQNVLGGIYSGRSPEFGTSLQDYEEALRWWQKSAAQGYSSAETNLGDAYLHGWGVAADVRQAIAWYERAVNRGDTNAGRKISDIYLFDGNAASSAGRSQRYQVGLVRGESEQLAQKEPQAHRWQTTTGRMDWSRVRAQAKLGDLDAQMQLATAYLQGNLGLPQSVRNAHHWYLKAAAQGNADALNNVGYTLYRGALGKREPEAARAWFEKAARAGSSNAMVSLAHMFEIGETGKRDVEKALVWLKQAAEANNAQAIERLVSVYRNGELGQKADFGKATYWSARRVPGGAKWKP
jgi:TPR repeat protein